MATAEELLAAEGLTVEYLDINFDTRTIFIPASIKNLGVEHDDDTKRLFFRMPLEYGEFNLYDFKIRVNYTNAEGHDDYYPIVDASVIDDKIIFSWLVGRYAYTKKGTVEFNVCLKKLDENYTVIKELNTTNGTLSVLPGKETGERIVQENPEIIEYILGNMGQPTDEQVEAAVDRYLEENPVVGGQGPTDEQVEAAVEKYMEENPIEGGSGSGATAEQLAQIDQNAKDIKTLSENQVVIDDTFTTVGAAADAKATGDWIQTVHASAWEGIGSMGAAINALSRSNTNTIISKTESTITITSTLEDGAIVTDVITIDENNYPVKIVSDGIECPITWEGF